LNQLKPVDFTTVMKRGFSAAKAGPAPNAATAIALTKKLDLFIIRSPGGHLHKQCARERMCDQQQNVFDRTKQRLIYVHLQHACSQFGEKLSIGPPHTSRTLRGR
jgi:hypothetical protein